MLRFEWNGDGPLGKLADTPASAPLQLEARLAQVDLAKLADTAKLTKLQQQRVRGVVDARLVASGTLGAPRATLSLDVKDVGTDRIQHVDAKAGVLLEKSKAALDGTVALDGSPALGFTAQAPFDLQRAVKDKAYLR